MELAQQTVLITGGARGLGRAVVHAFAAQGSRVVVNYRASASAAGELVQDIGDDRAVAIQADVTDPQAVQRLFATAREHFGTPVTTVVNNALQDFSFDPETRSTAGKIGWDEFHTQFGGSVRGAVNTIQSGLTGMRAAGFGRIINIGSNLVQNPVVPYHDYTAAKAALLSMTRTYATELGPDGITVNMVSGGLLRTTDASAATPGAVFDQIAGQTPLRHVVTPEEFADPVLFFASAWARAITGQNLIVDGGLVPQ